MAARRGRKFWAKTKTPAAIDVVFDPHNPNTLFAALWQVRRQPWFFSSGGPGSGLYRSTDGGTTWQQLQGNGLPEGILGRIGVTRFRRGFRSHLRDHRSERRRHFPFGRWRRRTGRKSMTTAASGSAPGISAKSTRTRKRPTRVYVLNTGAFNSVDGGKTFHAFARAPWRSSRFLD